MSTRGAVRHLGIALILIGTAIAAGAVTSAALERIIGPEAEHFAHAIGGIVSLAIILAAIVAVLDKSASQEYSDSTEEGI
jgi:heme A synthase